jgi:hypothetical protein
VCVCVCLCVCVSVSVCVCVCWFPVVPKGGYMTLFVCVVSDCVYDRIVLDVVIRRVDHFVAGRRHAVVACRDCVSL